MASTLGYPELQLLVLSLLSTHQERIVGSQRLALTEGQGLSGVSHLKLGLNYFVSDLASSTSDLNELMTLVWGCHLQWGLGVHPATYLP